MGRANWKLIIWLFTFLQHGTNRCLKFCEASPRPEVANGEVCCMVSLTVIVTWHDTCWINTNTYSTTDTSFQYHMTCWTSNNFKLVCFILDSKWHDAGSIRVYPSKDTLFDLNCNIAMFGNLVGKIHGWSHRVCTFPTFFRNHQVLRWALQVRGPRRNICLMKVWFIQLSLAT